MKWMELDVHIEREAEESWGFQIDGGADMNKPITVIKISPESPAQRAGLQNGDTIKKINKTVAEDCTQDAVMKIIEDAGNTLDLGLCRGLYDPVLDDQEPIYETYEPADFDPQSEPSEVQFKIQQFLESPSLDTDSLRPTPYDPSILLEPIRDSRSLTASPFSLSTKEYRPFSTEPLPDIPPVEDPIILNPNYRDVFGGSCDEYEQEEKNVETKFKLPVSEQYDPEGKKKKFVVEDDIIERKMIKITEEMLREIKMTKESVRKDGKVTEERSKEIRDVKETMRKEEIKFMENMKQEIDINKIEETALNIVDESIERAMSVTEEIKQEIYDERSFGEESEMKVKEVSSDKIKSKENLKSSDVKKEIKTMEEVKDNVELIEENTEQISNKKYSRSEKNIVQEQETNLENKIESKVNSRETEENLSMDTNQFTHKEIEELIIKRNEKEANVSAFDNQESKVEARVHKESVKSNEFTEKRENVNEIPRKRSIIHESNFSENESNVDRKESTQDKIYKTTSTAHKSRDDAARTQAEHRLYTIGLQTIPNIRGTVHSYHYDLLLKTFFIHLTDVMVALSRFILTQPVFSTSEDREVETTMREKVIKDTVQKNREEKYVTDRAVREEMMEKKAQKHTSSEVIHKEHQKQKQTTEEEVTEIVEKKRVESLAETSKDLADKNKEHVMKTQFVTEKSANVPERNQEENLSIEVSEKRLSGAKMAQRSERKSEELTRKMEAVISEFQTKASIEEPELRGRRRRSRSRSQIEEEVMRESDPLEWLAKVDSRRASQEIEIDTRQQFSSNFESLEAKKFESKHESRKLRTIKPKPGRQTYIAIVEAHVYTNKDVIFEDHVAEMSETLSSQSAEEVNTAFEASEAIVSEKIAYNGSEVQKETAKSLIQDSRKLSTISAKSEATVQIIEKSKEDFKENIKEVQKQQNATIARENNEAIVQEIQQIVEPVVAIVEKPTVKKNIQSVDVKEDSFVKTAAESTEFSDVTEHEVLNVQKIKSEKLTITAGENYSALQVSHVEAVSDELSDLKSSEKTELTKSTQIIEELDSALQVNEVEIAKDELTELKINKERTDTVQSIGVVEQAALEITEVESTNDDLAELKITNHQMTDAVNSVEVDDERQAAVQITEVNVRSSKDEFADLKITKQQVIDVSESIEFDEERSSSLQVSQVETMKDQISELKVCQQKNIAQSVEIFEQSDSAVQITEVDAVKEELSNLKQTKQANFANSVEIIEERDSALQISEVKAARDELAELKIIKKQEFEASQIIENEDTALQITEVNVESTRNEISDMKIENQQVEIAKSIEVVEEKGSAIKIPKVPTITDESAELKIIKEQVTEVQESLELESELNISEHLAFNKYQSYSQQTNEFDETIQESSYIAKSAEVNKKLTIRTDLESQSSMQSDENNNIDTPSPCTVPSTPIIDEYIFKLEIPLPKSRGTTPIPPEPSPEKETHDEDPHIVKKKLIPHVEIEIERIVYDPPLPTPPEEKPKPVYNKPGLRGGADRPQFTREEIREIERKSSLLASAIDETIKSIEEYKEEVGMETKKEVKNVVSKSEYSSTKTVENITTNKILENGDVPNDLEVEHDDKIDEEWIKVEKQVEDNNQNINELAAENVGNEENIKKMNETKAQKGISMKTDEPIIMDAEEINKTESKSDTKDYGKSVDANINEPIENKLIETETDVSALVVTDNNDKNMSELKAETEKTEVIEVEKQTEKVADIKDKAEVSLKDETKTVGESKEKSNIENEAERLIEGNEKSQTSSTAETPKTTEENVAKHDKANETAEDSGKIDYLQFVKPVKFDPEAVKSPRSTPVPNLEEFLQPKEPKVYVAENGEPIGTIQGIVDGLEEAVVDEEVAKELGKPGISEEKIAELISGEAEMLREAHVMGLSRVLTSHMNRVEDDSSVDFQKIKPMVDSLKDSEVLKALNEEIAKSEQEKKMKEEKRWTTFLQKPKRRAPRAKFGYYGYIEHEEEEIQEPYKVKIVKQPKPKIAPDYKPEDFDTGPLPWEERAVTEAALPPVDPEEPILIPEEAPEFLEAVDPLPESEVPDLEDTGIPLPPVVPKEPVVSFSPLPEVIPLEEVEVQEVIDSEPVVPETEKVVNMDETRLADELMRSVKSMVDPHAPIEKQLTQMRAQLAALAQLPGVIQQTLELVTGQLMQFSHQGMQQTRQEDYHNNTERYEETNLSQTENHEAINVEEGNNPQIAEVSENNVTFQEETENSSNIAEVQQSVPEAGLTPEELALMMKEEEEMLEEQRKSEKQRKEREQFEQESRLLKQRPTPRVGKPKPLFGPLNPEDRPLVLPGGRRWRGPQDAYNEQLIAETLQAQSELIQGKVMGLSYESELLPYDERQRDSPHTLPLIAYFKIETWNRIWPWGNTKSFCRKHRINFMKYEKPPVSLDHLQRSEVYKVVHNMDETPMKRVELLTPVIAEADYRKRCRSRTPNKIDEYHNLPQQLQP